MGILGVTLYNRFVNRMEDMTIESSEQLLNQTAINLETYLRNMRRISDAMYYSVIKDKDLASVFGKPDRVHMIRKRWKRSELFLLIVMKIP